VVVSATSALLTRSAGTGMSLAQDDARWRCMSALAAVNAWQLPGGFNSACV
jgi:hypothetical protein